MATLTRGSDLFDSDRYKYDFKLCSFANFWAQLDTKQDASYYGNWVNPFSLELVSYCEGDLTHTRCDDEADFVKTVRECCEWHREREYFIGIDAGTGRVKEAFQRLGLGDLLHGTGEDK